jgi:hypothetical protein
LAGYGVRPSGVQHWRKVKAGALRGFVKCSDGRLYHPLVAQKALTAWEGKLKQRHRTFGATIRKHNERNPERQLNAPSFEDWETHGRPEKVADFLHVKSLPPGPLFEPVGENGESVENPEMSRTTPANVTRDKSESHAVVACDMASKGKGERKGKGDSILESSPTTVSEPLLDTVQRICAAASVSVIQPNRLVRATDIVKRWLKDDIDVDATILPTIAKRLAAMRPDETVSSLAYFDSPVRKAHNLKPNRKSRTAQPATPLKVSDGDDPRIATVRQRLKADLGARTYDGWLGPKAVALTLNGSTALVTTATPFAAQWVEEHFLAQLTAATKAVAGIDDVLVRPQ